MEIKKWLSKYWSYLLFVILFFYWVSSKDSPKDSNSVTNLSNEQNVQTPKETPIETITLSEEEIEKNRIKEEKEKEEKEKEEKKRIYEQERERITGCLVGEFNGSWGTYTFSSNGTFSWEVNSGPYQQYRTGTWKYIGGNKVKLYKSWLSRSGTITISKYCEVFGLDF